MTDDDTITELDWCKGIVLSVVASFIGGMSKLAIRKSWLIEAEAEDNDNETVTAASSHSGDEQTTIQSTGDDDITTLSADDSCPSPQVSCNVPCSSEDVLIPPSEQETESRNYDHFGGDVTKKPPPPHPQMLLSKGLRYSGMFGLTILNPLCGIFAMNYASPSILAPFSGLTLVWIILCSEQLIGEKPNEAQTVAASLIVFGEVIIAVFGDHTNDALTVDEVRHSYKSIFFIFYFMCVTLWISFLFYWIKYSKSPTLERLGWGLGGGSLAGLQNFVKDALTIIKAVKDEKEQSGETATISDFPMMMWVMAFLATSVAVGGITILSICMKRYDATYSSSMFVGSFVISASIMSAFHYNTFANLEHAWNYIFYPIGLVILIMGVDLLLLDSTEGETIVSIDSSESNTTEPNLPSNLEEPLLDGMEERREYTVI